MLDYLGGVMNKEEILTLLPLLDEAEEFRPLIEKAFQVLKSC